MLSFSYVFTFLLSSTLEVPVYAVGYRNRMAFFRIFLLVTLANLFTHPIVFFGFMSSKWPYLWAVLGAETFAVVAESVLDFAFVPGVSFRRALACGFLANLVSWQLAPMITWSLLKSQWINLI